MTAHAIEPSCTSEQFRPVALAWAERWIQAVAAAPAATPPKVDEVALAWAERAEQQARRIEAIQRHPSFDAGTCPLCFGDHTLDACLDDPMRCLNCGADLDDDNETDLCDVCERL